MLALSVCSSIYISLCLFGYGDRFSSFMKKTSYALNSRAQFQSNAPFIYSFIHSSLRISLIENENPETQEKKKKNQKRAKCPRKKKKKQKIIKCLVIDCTADFIR